MRRRVRRALPRRRRPGAARGVPPAVHHAQPPGQARGDCAGRRPAHPLTGRRVPGGQLARAGDLGFLRHHLRRASRADPDPDAGRLEGPPAAQGLPARRHPGRVPRRQDPGAGRAEGLLMTQTPHAAAGATDAEAAEGHVYTVSGEDWDEIVAAANEARDFQSGERLVINMGPQHPSTHGVLRLVLTLEGETVVEVRPAVGYLHTGIEKNMEFRTWTQGVTFCTRADYLMPLFNEMAYCVAVERLLGIEDRIPERAQIIRVLMLELNRITSHLGGIAPMGLELGATTIYTQGARLRERGLDLLELITGLRMNHAYIRPGGVAQDLPPGALEAIRAFLDTSPELVRDLRTLIDANPVYVRRTKDIAFLDLAGCMALGVTGPILRATGLPWDLRKSQPYCGYETYDFDVPVT